MTFATINMPGGSINEEELARLTLIACDQSYKCAPLGIGESLAQYAAYDYVMAGVAAATSEQPFLKPKVSLTTALAHTWSPRLVKPSIDDGKKVEIAAIHPDFE